MPDIILGGLLFIVLILQSRPYLLLFIGLLSVTFVHYGLSNFFSSIIPDVITPIREECTGRFPGFSYEKLITASLGLSKSNLTDLITSNFPSYYFMFLTSIIGYSAMLFTTYKDELENMPTKRAMLMGCLITLGTILFILMITKFMSECDSISSMAIATVFGLGYGSLLHFVISKITNRYGTNILNIPLLEESKMFIAVEKNE
jgi:hypothetical protein